MSFFHESFNELFQYTGGAHTNHPSYYHPIINTFNMISTPVAMDIFTLSMTFSSLALTKIAHYLSILLIPFDRIQPLVSSPCTALRSTMINPIPIHHITPIFYSLLAPAHPQQTVNMLASSCRARSYRFLPSTRSCILSLKGSPSVLACCVPFPTLVITTIAGRLSFVWYLSSHAFLLGVSVSYISHFHSCVRGLWHWVDYQSPLVPFRNFLFAFVRSLSYNFLFTSSSPFTP